MKPLAFIASTALTGLAAGFGYYLYDSSKVVELIPGQKYLVIANGFGESDTNWQKVAEELKKLGLKEIKLSRSEDKAVLTYVLNSTGFSKLKIGQPIFQVEDVQFVAKDISRL